MASNKYIYLAFYAYSLDSSLCFSPLNKVIDIFSGPFTHVQVCYEPPRGIIWPKVYALNITGDGKGIQKGVYSMDRPGYLFVRLPITSREFNKLIAAESKLLSHPTHMDRVSMVLGSANTKLTGEEAGWFCSQMVDFLLVECGWLDASEDNSPSVTGLYLKVKQKAVDKGFDIELNHNPYNHTIALPTCSSLFG